MSGMKTERNRRVRCMQLLGIDLVMPKLTPENLQYDCGPHHCREATRSRDHNDCERERNFPRVPLARVQQITLAKKHDGNYHRDQGGEPGIAPTGWTVLGLRAPTSNARDVGPHDCRYQEEDGDFDHDPNLAAHWPAGRSVRKQTAAQSAGPVQPRCSAFL
jgi:hypothetical protein